MLMYAIISDTALIQDVADNRGRKTPSAHTATTSEGDAMKVLYWAVVAAVVATAAYAFNFMGFETFVNSIPRWWGSLGTRAQGIFAGVAIAGVFLFVLVLRYMRPGVRVQKAFPGKGGRR